MKFKSLYLSLSLLFLMISTPLFSQKNIPQGNNSIEATLGGTAAIGSVTYSRFFKIANDYDFGCLSIGFLYVPGSSNSWYSIPIGYTYNSGNGTHYLELGGGLTFIGLADEGFLGVDDDDFKFLMPTATVGWRWMIGRNVVFRANINALLINYIPIPFPGLGLGVRF